MKKTALGFLFVITVMLVIGVVMLFSTGAFARDAHGDPTFFIKRQAVWMAISLVACVVAACLDYRLLQRYWKWLFGLAVILLIAVYFFEPINGSRRWIRMGGFSFQPSEIGKLAAVVFVAAWYSHFAQHSKEFLKGFVYPLAVTGILMGLIVFEEDLGATALIGGTVLMMMFVAGSNMFYLGITGIGGIVGILGVAASMPERVHRLLSFMDLEKHRLGSGLQQWEGLIALGSGGVEGLGLGNGRQKMEFLPFAHTDFIFPMIGEELGLIFTLLIVFCYVVLIVCGLRICMNARDRFGALLGMGLIFLIALQAGVNIGVTTGLLPNKGLPLPFISYGGSNLLFCMVAVGIVMSIYRQGNNERSVESRTLKRQPAVLARI